MPRRIYQLLLNKRNCCIPAGVFIKLSWARFFVRLALKRGVWPPSVAITTAVDIPAFAHWSAGRTRDCSVTIAAAFALRLGIRSRDSYLVTMATRPDGIDSSRHVPYDVIFPGLALVCCNDVVLSAKRWQHETTTPSGVRHNSNKRLFLILIFSVFSSSSSIWYWFWVIGIAEVSCLETKLVSCLGVFDSGGVGTSRMNMFRAIFFFSESR